MVVFGPPPNLFQEGVSHVDYDEHKGVLPKCHIWLWLLMNSYTPKCAILKFAISSLSCIVCVVFHLNPCLERPVSSAGLYYYFNDLTSATLAASSSYVSIN